MQRNGPTPHAAWMQNAPRSRHAIETGMVDHILADPSIPGNRPKRTAPAAKGMRPRQEGRGPRGGDRFKRVMSALTGSAKTKPAQVALRQFVTERYFKDRDAAATAYMGGLADHIRRDLGTSDGQPYSVERHIDGWVRNSAVPTWDADSPQGRGFAAHQEAIVNNRKIFQKNTRNRDFLDVAEEVAKLNRGRLRLANRRATLVAKLPPEVLPGPGRKTNPGFAPALQKVLGLQLQLRLNEVKRLNHQRTMHDSFGWRIPEEF